MIFMRTAGIISEYNPFHRGHAWQIGELRRRLGAETAVVCAMSGSFVGSFGRNIYSYCIMY